MAINWEAGAAGIETATAQTAEEFIEALRLSNAHWWDDAANASCPWVFRGHAREVWKLLPTAWRADNEIVRNSVLEATRRFDAVRPNQSLGWHFQPNFVTGAVQFSDNDAALARRLTIKTTAEYLPLWDFANACDEQGMPVPLAGTPPDSAQDPDWLAMGASLPLLSDELLRFSDLPATLALAQHHGIPTRLLDWTRNPIAAAFFAVELIREPEKDANLVVWAIHKRRTIEASTEGVIFPNAPIQPLIAPRIKIVRPLTRDNEFMAAQAGLFTTIEHSGIYFMKSNGRRPAIEDFVTESNPQLPLLRKLILSHEQAPAVMRILQRENIFRSTLMPTMDNVARDVRMKWGRDHAPYQRSA